ncbi:MAG: carbon monoxide dehydrogenase, partial [Phycisphaerae bacterium]|nr:carbon monoxide dehydrogenase [Phycisphaerae bacterium]
MLEQVGSCGLSVAWDRHEAMEPQCGFGQLGICCRNCTMGPCRIDPFGDGPAEGICGATADVIAARNMVRMIAA